MALHTNDMNMELDEGTCVQEGTSSATCGWKNIPEEIKIKILRYRLIIRAPITNMNHPSHSRRCLLPLMLANKDTGRLAREVYYGDNRFILDNNPINYVQNWQNFRTPHPAQRSWIRNLELHMYAWGMEPDEDVQSDEVQKYELSWPRELRQHSLLHHLFEPLSGGMRKEDKRGYMCHAYSTDTKRPIVKSMMSASWQNGFTGVRDLKIVLIGSPCFTNIHGFPYGRRKPEGAVGRLSSRVRIPMSARRVEVVLKKGERWTSRTCCSELCPKIFKSLVESLVHIRTGAEEKADDAI